MHKLSCLPQRQACADGTNDGTKIRMLKLTNIVASILFLLLWVTGATISSASEKLELVSWGSVLPNATIDTNRASLNVEVKIGDDVPL